MPIIRTSSLGASSRTSFATIASSTRRHAGSIGRVYSYLTQSQQYAFKSNLVRKVNPSLLQAQPPQIPSPIITSVIFVLTNEVIEATVFFINAMPAPISTVFVNGVQQNILAQSPLSSNDVVNWQAKFIVSGLPTPLSNGSKVVVSLLQGSIKSQNYNFYVGTPVVRDLNVTSLGKRAYIQYIGIDNTSTYLGGLSAPITNLQYILKNNSGNTLTTAVLDWDPTPTFPISIGENLTNNTQYSLGVRAENKYGFGPYYYVTFTTS